MAFEISDYRKACANYDRYWRLADETLYELCRLHPGHEDRAAVNAKLLIIGRSYATGIERAIRSKGTQASSLEQLADHLEAEHQKADALLGRLCRIKEPLTVNTLHDIVMIHGEFLELLRPVTHSGWSTRSFGSKYLHFHCPLVPIFDNIAAAWMSKLVRMSGPVRVFDTNGSMDAYYVDYVLRVWHLYQTIRASEPSVTMKYVDNYVLWYAYGASAPVKEPVARP